MNAYKKDLLEFGSPKSLKPGAMGSLNGPGDETREEQLQKLGKHKLDAIQKARLKITLEGEEIVVTDQICKIVRTILSFKDVIGAGISAEPHAAWRGPDCVRTSAPWEGILDLWCRIYSELACALPPDL